MTTPSSNSPHDPERRLAEVFDALTSAGAADACMHIAGDAAGEMADVDGVCLLSRDGERCLIALTQQQQIYLCDLRSSGFHRVSMSTPRTEPLATRMFWAKEDSIALSDGVRRPIGAALVIPVQATSGYAAIAFFWRPGHTTDPQYTRKLELLAKALGLAAGSWRKDKEHAVQQSDQHRISTDLQHRLRNNLALMRSVVRRSHETAESAEHFALHLEARIGALARIQGTLVAVAETGVEIEDLIRTELAACAAHEQRYALQGPAVRLHAKGAESMALAMHELATNSVKFGALGASNGRLEVTWSITWSASAESLPRLLISWVESGVNIVSGAPRRRGFGQELIECSLPYELGAQTRLEFTPGGVLCEIEVPLEACATSVEPARYIAQGGLQ